MRRALLLVAPLVFASAAAARDVPVPRYPLRDDAGLLDRSTADAVRAVCIQLEHETTAELGVLIIDTTSGEDSRGFALRVFNAWGVGKAGSDNGVLLVFAMRDRRVELMAGIGYEDLFTKAASERLLTGVVVPRMRAGQPREAVLEGARAVAEKIRELERGRGRWREDLRDGRVELATFGGGRPEGSRPLPAAAATPRASAPRTTRTLTTTPTPSPARPSPGLLSPGTRGRLGRDLVRAVVFVGLLGWAGFLCYTLWRTFKTGELVVSKGAVIALALLVPLAAVAVLLLTAPAVDRTEPVDWGLGGGGLLAGVIACGVTSHICPRCYKWMSIHSRTLVSPTYSSSGRGERTYHCRNCSYHKVETYTISRKTRSSSRSSYGSSSRSSSGGGRSSFGGGSSRGGGGGASW